MVPAWCRRWRRGKKYGLVIGLPVSVVVECYNARSPAPRLRVCAWPVCCTIMKRTTANVDSQKTWIAEHLSSPDQHLCFGVLFGGAGMRGSPKLTALPTLPTPYPHTTHTLPTHYPHTTTHYPHTTPTLPTHYPHTTHTLPPHHTTCWVLR